MPKRRAEHKVAKAIIQIEKLRSEKNELTTQDRELIQSLERGVYRRQTWVVALSLLTLALGILINEVCVSPDYVTQFPSEAELEALARGASNSAYARSCDWKYGNILKSLCSLSVICLLVAILIRFKQEIQLKQTKKRLQEKNIFHMFGSHAREHLIKITKRELFWLVAELGICMIHPFPFYKNDYEWNVLGRPLFYRFESIMCALMLVRLFHLWSWILASLYLLFFNLESSYRTQDFELIKSVQQLSQDRGTSYRMLSFKIAMSKSPPAVIAVCTIMVLMPCSYLFRLSEGPAYVDHSRYFWDQVWNVLTQATTGYGMTSPATHIGRMACFVCIAWTPIVIALTTASTTSSLKLSGDEDKLIKRMNLNQLHLKLMEAAASVIQQWWRWRGSWLMPSELLEKHRLDTMTGFYKALHDFNRFKISNGFTHLLPQLQKAPAKLRRGSGSFSFASTPRIEAMPRPDLNRPLLPPRTRDGCEAEQEARAGLNLTPNPKPLQIPSLRLPDRNLSSSQPCNEIIEMLADITGEIRHLSERIASLEEEKTSFDVSREAKAGQILTCFKVHADVMEAMAELRHEIRQLRSTRADEHGRNARSRSQPMMPASNDREDMGREKARTREDLLETISIYSNGSLQAPPRSPGGVSCLVSHASGDLEQLPPLFQQPRASHPQVTPRSKMRRILDKARLALLPSPRLAADICISSPHGHLMSLPEAREMSATPSKDTASSHRLSRELA
ncbi:hypothetical protein GUITHDRAFT_109853 [Guillardia theta CCMP2712]|uniref:Potassium channel domain-containing protein n=1 Tax=Guillardia theta (strain CCMP2712) TaxID=905079 RepID=L1J6U4_GUITC|nr:hypothetical protein GUITHDRAFT_109853 [Guillardia theta CCMP2712]EKX44067.1 hypothetical protein GUITHDRAFT_109853 [Guillardia theta CCMP2712]|eukprot:XP_005831047.1 hypothetical protein GUITHDRAFT_109853 [Guillardia theta CCMP2712]